MSATILIACKSQKWEQKPVFINLHRHKVELTCLRPGLTFASSCTYVNEYPVETYTYMFIIVISNPPYFNRKKLVSKSVSRIGNRMNYYKERQKAQR